jgi:hypothetical protein
VRVPCLPISNCLRKFNELEYVAKLRQVPDVRLADLRHCTADHTDKGSHRIHRDARFHFERLAEKLGLRPEQAALADEQSCSPVPKIE